MDNPAILVFGSINVDLMMPVFSFPKSGETVLTEEVSQTPGGKGANQAIAAQRAGVKTMFAGSVGSDGHAETALSLLRREGVDLSLVTVSDRLTGCAFILVDKHGENIISVASGANLDTRADQIDDDSLTNFDVLLLQQEVSLEQNFRLASRARQKGVKVIYNFAPSGRVSRQLFSKIDYLIVNEVEAPVIVAPERYNDPAEMAKRLCQKYGFAVVITLGAKGAVAATEKSLFRILAPSVGVVDTTGAGDTFCGYLAAEVAKGHNLGDSCLEIAIQAASIACTRAGAQSGIPHRYEVF